MEVVASLSQGRTAAAQCGMFTNKLVPVIFEPPCISSYSKISKEDPKILPSARKTKSSPKEPTTKFSILYVWGHPARRSQQGPYLHHCHI